MKSVKGNPTGDVEERALRLSSGAYIEPTRFPRMVQAWLTGVNPEVGDRVPLRALRDGDLGTVAPEIVGTARAFIAGAKWAESVSALRHWIDRIA
jgi:hypothetical protein